MSVSAARKIAYEGGFVKKKGSLPWLGWIFHITRTSGGVGGLNGQRNYLRRLSGGVSRIPAQHPRSQVTDAVTPAWSNLTHVGRTVAVFTSRPSTEHCSMQQSIPETR